MQIKKIIISCLFFYFSSFLIGSFVYAALLQSLEGGYVIAVLPRLVPYYHYYPYQYICMISLIYSVVSLIWISFFKSQSVIWRRINILVVIFLTLTISSVFCGMLWCLHDSNAGFWPTTPVLINNLMSSAINGLLYGWAIIFLSMPYNFITFILGFVFTDKAEGYLNNIFERLEN